MKTRYTSLLLAALMLFLQSATLVHAVDHAYVEHTKICEVFATADKHGLAETFSPPLLADSPQTLAVLYPELSHFTPYQSAYSSRAPPLS